MASSTENHPIVGQLSADDTVSGKSISIIIPTYNGEQCIGLCLESILAQSRVGPLQIIIVDDGSCDNTATAAKNFAPDAAVYENVTNRGMSATWNFGIECADGEIIALIDQDCIAKNDWLANLTSRFFTSAETLAVQGNFYLQYFSTTISNYHARWRRSAYLEKHAIDSDSNDICLRTINTRNVAFHKDALAEVKRTYQNVFDERNAKGAGDLELGRRLYEMGVKIHFEESAEVYHMDPASLLGILNQKYRHAFFDAQAGFTENTLDVENFKRVVINPAKNGVPIWFSLPIWLVSMYGYKKGFGR